MERRTFLALPAFAAFGSFGAASPLAAQGARIDIAQLERRRVLGLADRYLRESPITITKGWPVRHHSLFGGLALNRPDYIAVWRKLDPDPTVDEIIRNYFVRQPVLWLT